MTSESNTQAPSMKFFCYSICMLAMSLGALAQAVPPEARLPKEHLALLKSNCFECHDSFTEEGDVDLETLPFNISKNMKTAETWQKVLNAINSGEMPPEDEKQISASEKTAFLDDLSNHLVTARKVLSDSGGVITMRRLNRREYRNTIKGLLGVGIDAKSLPQDGGGGTFDTVGASQFMSSDQLEQYLKLGRSAIDEVFDRQANAERKATVYRMEPETVINPDNEKIVKNFEEEHQRFLRWKTGVDKAAVDPKNQKKITELRQKDPKLRKLYSAANQLKGSPDPREFGFKDAQKAAFSNTLYDRRYPYFKHYVDLPHREKGTYLKLHEGTVRIDFKPPWDMPVGTYILRVRAGVVAGSPASRHFMEIGHPQQVNEVKSGLEGFPISSHQITGTLKHPAILETHLKVSAKTRREFSIQERQPSNKRDFNSFYYAAKKTNGYGPDPAIWLDWIELEGPIPETGTLAVLHQILDKHSKKAAKSEQKRALAILTEFADAALRRVKPDAKFIDQLLAIYQTRRKIGEPFDVAIRTPLSVILASPGFLYLNEAGGEKERRKLTDRELAVRLAYFLWSAPPDRQLLELAKKEELRKPEVLRQEVDRMIADPRSDEFVSGFVHQWLDMERLDFFQFDVKRHREFDESTRAASREEVYQSFTHLFRGSDNGRLGKLLNSDYVMINGLLGNYYGIDGVTGDAFRKVKLPADSPRGGLLGMAAIHAMGSDGVESSPVERGAWVLRHLLNDPPPPAPPNVPQLSRLADQPLSARQRVLAHQEEPQCASCHRKIDPIGFGMENFDAAGKWRTTERHVPKDKKASQANKGKKTVWEIDPSGKFHNGPEFSNYHEMRDLIAKSKEDKFARGFTEHLIEYALGRPFGFTDEDLANGILSSAKSKDYSVSEFFQSLVATQEFQSK